MVLLRPHQRKVVNLVSVGESEKRPRMVTVEAGAEVAIAEDLVTILTMAPITILLLDPIKMLVRKRTRFAIVVEHPQRPLNSVVMAPRTTPAHFCAGSGRLRCTKSVLIPICPSQNKLLHCWK